MDQASTKYAVAERQPPIDLSGEKVRAVVALNLEVCLGLLKVDLKSLAVRADIEMVRLVNVSKGMGGLNVDVVDALCEELHLQPANLLYDYGGKPAATERLRRILDHHGALPDEEAELEDGKEEAEIDPPASQEEGPAPTSSAEDQSANTSLSWSEDDTVATGPGGKTFDLKEKKVRSDIMGRFRTLLAEAEMTITTLLADSGIDKTSGWFGSVEKGNSRIFGKEFLALCDVVDVEPSEVLEGGDIVITRPQRGSKAVQEVITIQSVTADEVQEYFRTLVLSRRTKPVEGVEPGEILALAANPKETDWQETFLSMTTDGATVQRDIESLTKILSGKHPVLQNIMLHALAEALKGKGAQ